MDALVVTSIASGVADDGRDHLAFRGKGETGELVVGSDFVLLSRRLKLKTAAFQQLHEAVVRRTVVLRDVAAEALLNQRPVIR